MAVDNPDEKKILAAASPRIIPGDPIHNAQLIISAAETAEADHADMLIFPEMCLNGVTLGTIAANNSVDAVVRQCMIDVFAATKELKVLICLPHTGVQAGLLKSCITLGQAGEVQGLVTLGYDEYPYGFRPAARYEMINNHFNHTIPNFQIVGAPLLYDDDIFYRHSAYMLVPSGFNATARSYEDTQDRLKYVSLRHGMSVAYASPNTGESSARAVFDGYCAIASGGELLAESDPFAKEAYCAAEVGILPKRDVKTEAVPKYEDYLHPDPERALRECRRILELQAVALERRLTHIHGKGFVVGVSGGLDSALALLACCAACDRMGLPRSAVLGVSMPGFGSSSRTQNNSQLLVEALGCEFKEISIIKSCLSHFDDIGHDRELHDVVFENTQARQRTLILLSLANQYGLLDVGTGDLSEEALGWTTFGGDNLAQYGINGSLPKTVIRRVVNEARNRFPEAEAVLRDILATPVSPELLPTVDGEISQKTESILGSYELHDFFIYNMVFRRLGVADTFMLAAMKKKGAPREIADALGVFIRRLAASEFKRRTAPECPNLLVSLAPPDFDIPGDITIRVWEQEYEGLVNALGKG